MSLPIPEREALRTALGVLSPRDRRLYWVAVGLQFLLALMDLAGVLLLGMVGALLASTAGGSAVPAPVAGVLDTLGLGSATTATAAFALAAAAAVLLIAKSALALLIQSRLLRFLGRRAGAVGAELARGFLGLPMLQVRRHPSQVTSFALMEGVNGLITGILGSFMVVVSEVALLVVLGVALLVIDPLTTAVAVAYFGGIALLLNRRLGVLARSAGRATAESNIAGRTVIQDAVDTYPEIAVMRRRGVFVERFAGERHRYAEAQATSMLLGAVPRYLMEAAMVLGAALMAATLALTNDLAGAVGGIVLFLAAASRVVPALLRLNSAVISMRNQATAAGRAGDLAEQVRAGEERGVAEHGWGFAEERVVPDAGEKPAVPNPPRLNEADATVDATAAPTEVSAPPSPTAADIALTEVSLRYPERDGFALADITLKVAAGQSLALVGPTGAGKSSLVAVILGLVEPTAGTVRVGGVAPATGAAEFAVVEPQSLPVAAATVGYVPQDVALVFGTVRDNVALGIPEEAIDDAAVWAALQRAHLAEFVRTLPAQLNTVVGERGVRLSGGQRQRLGLARALYTPPRLLVLDEATSALDAETERAIAETIGSLSGEVTTVTVAHRLATIREADIVAYLDGGRLVAQGTFEQVRAAVPGFERQAQLLGL